MANEPVDTKGKSDPELEVPEYIQQQRQRQERREEKLRIDDVDVDELSKVAGGYFRMTSLMQKRLRELIRYVPEATRFDNKQLISNVIEEIEQSAIEFEPMIQRPEEVMRGSMFDDE